MLVLSRQRDETIMIGDNVEITVVDVRGDKVRLGITAPREVQVHRKEVYDAIKRENAAASRIQVDDINTAAREIRGLKSSQGGGGGNRLGHKPPNSPEPREECCDSDRDDC